MSDNNFYKKVYGVMGIIITTRFNIECIYVYTN